MINGCILLNLHDNKNWILCRLMLKSKSLYINLKKSHAILWVKFFLRIYDSIILFQSASDWWYLKYDSNYIQKIDINSTERLDVCPTEYVTPRWVFCVTGLELKWHLHQTVITFSKAWCKTIVTTLFYITSYNSFAPNLYFVLSISDKVMNVGGKP